MPFQELILGMMYTMRMEKQDHYFKMLQLFQKTINCSSSSLGGARTNSTVVSACKRSTRKAFAVQQQHARKSFGYAAYKPF